MPIILNIVLLIVGFVLLIKGADVFVDASVAIAAKLHVPHIIIGLTIVAMGTSLPEMVISLSAALNGSNDMAVGNVIGSNMFNSLLILGSSALILPIVMSFKDISRDLYVCLCGTIALLVMMLVFEDAIPRLASLALFIVFICYTLVLIRQAIKNSREGKLVATDIASKEKIKDKPLWQSFLLAVLGAGLIVAGGQTTITNATTIALTFGMTERIVGLTILAAGTSLPELVTSMVAAKKGNSGIAVGNVIGSNIFNLLLVLGVAGSVFPLGIDAMMLADVAALLVAVIAAMLFLRTGGKIGRVEGGLMVVAYFGYMAYTVMR